MRARPALNAALQRAGVEVRRKPPALVRSAHELRLSLDHLAAHLAARSGDRQLTAVQVGAFDGTANDPLADALNRFGWSAVLVEPQPSAFARLQQLHAGNARVRTVQAAIADTDGERDLFYVDPAPELPSWTQQLASFDREHLRRQLSSVPGGTEQAIRVRTVPTVTFERLLAESGVDRVDVLQVDTEGYDWQVLQLFDVPQRLPSIIGYEHEHLSRRDRAAAVDLLVRVGYRVAMLPGGFDTLAYRPASSA